MLAGRRGQAWRHQPAFRRPRHFHDEPEINLVTRGWCTVGVGDRRLELASGQLIVFHPGQDHELLAASPDLDLFVFALRPELHDRALGHQAPPASEISGLSAAQLSQIETELSALAELRDTESADARVADLFARALAAAPKVQATSRRVLAALRSEHALSESTLAARLRTNPSSISRDFRHALGVPLVEYRARLRLMHFVQLVDHGASFTRAALEADFGSYAQCHRVFRRTLRCSPQTYFAGLRSQRDAETAYTATRLR
jgi:AraC-like DNA-binding protein